MIDSIEAIEERTFEEIERSISRTLEATEGRIKIAVCGVRVYTHPLVSLPEISPLLDMMGTYREDMDQGYKMESLLGVEVKIRKYRKKAAKLTSQFL